MFCPARTSRPGPIEVTAPAPLLKVDALAKRFCRDTARSLRYGVSDMLQELVPHRSSAPQLRPHEFWAINDVSFSIAPGEAVAIGGRNGAGKTTLLRLLAGLLKPDIGTIARGGTINPVIELGQGLNQMLTGRENAEIGLAWRGQTAAAIRHLLPEVEAFAELGQMFDAPVHSYSAGMRVRLAFAIAISVPCDLLLLDEVLAVGDLAFQRKCIEHMQQHLGRGGALILVSHNPIQMQALCRRGILLEQGKLVLDDSIEKCLDLMFELQAREQVVPIEEAASGSRIRVDAVEVRPASGSDHIFSGDDVFVDMTFSVSERVRANLSFSILTRDLSVCLAFFATPVPDQFEPGKHTRRCRIPKLPLTQGAYAIRATIGDPETYMPLATLGHTSAPAEFRVAEPLSRANLVLRHVGQLVTIEHEWLG